MPVPISSTRPRTRMAKSVYDASWSSFRDEPRYKAMAHGVPKGRGDVKLCEPRPKTPRYASAFLHARLVR
jgi:hypothetical protein